MKKITSVLMLSMAFVLASCGGGSTGLSVSESPTPTPSASSETSASSSVTPTSSSVTPASSSSEPAASSSVTPASSSSEPAVSSSVTPTSSSVTPEESSPAESSAESSEADPTYIVSVKDVIVNVAVTKPSTGTDKGYFELALEAEDYVKVTFGSSTINFAGYNGDAYEEARSSFTADLDGDYKFYITNEDVIWVTRQENHSGEQTVHLYTKYAITNEQTALVAYVWAWSDEVAGSWALATHVTETWEAESNRHYSCTISDPVGMKVILAIFSADSGVDADHEPNANWDGCVLRSGSATIEDWTTSVGANVYGQA